jgi:hypothetical protein
MAEMDEGRNQEDESVESIKLNHQYKQTIVLQDNNHFKLRND